MKKLWPEAGGPGLVGAPYAFMHLPDSRRPTCPSGLCNLLREEPWPLAVPCYLSLLWVRTPQASSSDWVSHKGSGSCCHFRAPRKYLLWERRSGFPDSCPNRVETQPGSTGGGGALCSSLGQETEEGQNTNPSLILPLINSSEAQWFQWPFQRCLCSKATD